MPVPPTRVAEVNLSTERAAASTGSEVVLEAPLNVAVNVTNAVVDTALVVAVKLTLVAPDSTVSVAGTTTLELLEVIDTTFPVGPAFPPRVTVTWVLVPPIAAAGAAAIVVTGAGRTVRVACKVAAPNWAVRVTAVVEETAVVVTGKFTSVAPAGTSTLGGTVTPGFPLLSVTLFPAGPATPLRYTAAFSLVPPMTEGVVNPNPVSAAGVRVTVVWTLVEPVVAVIVTTSLAETGFVLNEVEASVAPDAAVIEAGTTASALLLVKLIRSPLGPAAPLR